MTFFIRHSSKRKYAATDWKVGFVSRERFEVTLPKSSLRPAVRVLSMRLSDTLALMSRSSSARRLRRMLGNVAENKNFPTRFTKII